jgi:ribonuclease HI/uncharacterized phage-like protein YoqJ
LLTTIVYTDGACSGNPGPGGWAWVVPDGPFAAGHAHRTTNQRMEINAALQAVLANAGPLEIRSDSAYVVNCFRDGWWRGWLARDWRNSQRKPVKNRDLWEPLIDAYRQRAKEIRFTWVKGHSGDRWNDVADRLAVQAMRLQDDFAGDNLPADPDEIGPPDPFASTAPDHVASPSDDSGVADDVGGTSQELDESPATSGPTGPRTLDGSAGLPEHAVLVLGQRNVPAEAADDIRARMVRHLTERAREQPDLVVATGLRQGAEQLGAEAAETAGLPYLVVLPYPEPDRDWPPDEREHFADLLSRARELRLLQEQRPETAQGATAALRRRDAWLADYGREAVVVWDGQEPRTGHLYHTLADRIGDGLFAVDPGTAGSRPTRTRRPDHTGKGSSNTAGQGGVG